MTSRGARYLSRDDNERTQLLASQEFNDDFEVKPMKI